MNAPRFPVVTDPAYLLAARQMLRQREPGLRPLEAAQRLGVSEAELIAAESGRDALRLGGNWARLLRALPTLGTVEIETANAFASLRRHMDLRGLRVDARHARLETGSDVLRLRFAHWHSGFAVREGERVALRFFDRRGSAVLSVRSLPGADTQAFGALCSRYALRGRAQPLCIGRHDHAAFWPASTLDAGWLRARWAQLTQASLATTLLRSCGLGRQQALRLLGDPWARRLPSTDARQVLEHAWENAELIQVTVSSAGALQRTVYCPKSLRRQRCGIAADGEDVYLMWGTSPATALWQVRTPDPRGTCTTVEAFDASERALASLGGTTIAAALTMPMALADA